MLASVTIETGIGGNHSKLFDENSKLNSFSLELKGNGFYQDKLTMKDSFLCKFDVYILEPCTDFSYDFLKGVAFDNGVGGSLILSYGMDFSFSPCDYISFCIMPKAGLGAGFMQCNGNAKVYREKDSYFKKIKMESDFFLAECGVEPRIEIGHKSFKATLGYEIMARGFYRSSVLRYTDNNIRGVQKRLAGYIYQNMKFGIKLWV